MLKHSELMQPFKEIEQYKGINPTFDKAMAPILFTLKCAVFFLAYVLMPVTLMMLSAKMLVVLVALFVFMALGGSGNPELFINHWLDVLQITYLENLYMDTMQSIFF